MLDAAQRRELTFRHERRRAIANGILETGGSTFLLLIAVRHFHAGPAAKAMVAGGGSFGLILSLLVVFLVARLGWPASLAASRLAFVGTASFLAMAAFPVLPVFVAGSILSMAAASSSIPLMTQVYQENYPDHERGSLFAKTVMIRIGVAALFSEAAGRFLSQDIGQFRLLLLVFAVAFAVSGVCLQRCPARPLQPSKGTHPFSGLRYALEDRLFRQTLIAWMLMGFANLMMLPMRVEYLANPRYGLSLSVSEIAFLTGVLPNVARLLLSPVWGWLFDRMNFFVLRMTLNVGFALGILAFFTSDSVTGLIFGALIFGVSNAGGDVAWGLWVTKIAPPERVADYMSVHTFFTGLRGVVAPLLAFHLAAGVSLSALAQVSALLIGVATLMLIPEIRSIRGRRPATALVEEVSE
jgi:MFS family permease